MTYDPWEPLRMREVAEPEPIRALRDLGLGRPGWWREDAEQTLDGWKVFCTFLNARDVQQIAALTLEGWQVQVHPRGPRSRITLTAPKEHAA